MARIELDGAGLYEIVRQSGEKIGHDLLALDQKSVYMPPLGYAFALFGRVGELVARNEGDALEMVA